MMATDDTLCKEKENKNKPTKRKSSGPYKLEFSRDTRLKQPVLIKAASDGKDMVPAGEKAEKIMIPNFKNPPFGSREKEQ